MSKDRTQAMENILDELLLQPGVDVNLGEPKPLSVAAQSGSGVVVMKLIQAGANISHENHEAMRLALDNHPSVVNILKKEWFRQCRDHMSNLSAQAMAGTPRYQTPGM